MPDRDRIALMLVETLPQLMRNLGAHMRCHGGGLVPAHFRMLGMLSKRSHNLSELAELQSVTTATMSNSVAILVERGLVERTPSPSDRRVVQLSLTPAGCAALDAVLRSMTARIVHQMESISDTDVEALEAGLMVLQQVLLRGTDPTATCADTVSEVK